MMHSISWLRGRDEWIGPAFEDAPDPARAGDRVATEVRPILIRFTTVALVAFAISAVAVLASSPRYPLLVNRDGLPVYGPPTRPHFPARIS